MAIETWCPKCKLKTIRRAVPEVVICYQCGEQTNKDDILYKNPFQAIAREQQKKEKSMSKKFIFDQKGGTDIGGPEIKSIPTETLGLYKV